ncbi:MAG: hypothetical protein EBR70_03245 [Verrucomicrobia bacterium]|nr:hypothetical protein [Verrucomicrobiota bacterium]
MVVMVLSLGRAGPGSNGKPGRGARHLPRARRRLSCGHGHPALLTPRIPRRRRLHPRRPGRRRGQPPPGPPAWPPKRHPKRR